MASNGTTPGNRKRGRPQNDDAEVEDDPSSLSSTKKRRLNDAGSTNSSTSAVPRSLRAISSAISGAFGYGRRTVSANGAVKKGSAPVDTSWEVPDSDEEKKKKAGDKKANKEADRTPTKQKAAKSVYDFSDTDSDDAPIPILSSRARGRLSSSRSDKSGASIKAVPKLSGANSSGKPKRVSGQGTSQESAEDAARLRTYGRKSRARKVQPEEESEGKTPDETSEDEDNSSETALPSSTAVRPAAKRGRPPGIKSVNDSSKLKGNLTPRKKDHEPNRKSVAFHSDDKAADEEVHFEDAPGSVKPVKPIPQPLKDVTNQFKIKTTKPAVEESGEAEDDPEEDDEVCSVCSKPDSKVPNLMLLCDGCDFAVHQKCYGVPKIPKGDWFCRECAKNRVGTSQKLAVNGTKANAITAVPEVAPDIPNFEKHLRSLQRVLLDRCTGRRRIPIRDQEEAYEKIFQLVEQTVLAGEGNSMLIIGARGSGKTTMIETVITDLGREHKSEFHVVRLNGFIHTDDKLALKDIWRQLGREMEVEDDLIGKTHNYADTLASLLALLSHPSEIAEENDGVTSKSVVFIIDEFDLFATHARQTLLYNLFDIAQARKAPIAVLGLTNRIDVVESLEKRVKSRFSHRYVYLSLSKSLPAYWAICRQGLTVDEDDAKSEGIDVTLKGFTKFREFWEKKVEKLYKEEAFKDHLEYHFYSSKSVPAFLSSCVLPLSAISPTSISLRITPGAGAGLSIDAPDSKLHILKSLSDLDLSLLIAAARLDIVAHTDTVNFAMAYDEYTALIGKQRLQSATSGMLALGGGVRVWGRGVAEIAWERLASLGVLIPAGLGSGRGGLAHGGIEARMWKVDVALEEIPVAVKMNAILTKWCKEI